MSEVESDILTLEEVAAYLKAGKRTVYRLPGGHPKCPTYGHPNCSTRLGVT